MRLASLGEFRRLIYTPDSAPSLNTLRARVRNGRLAGGVIDGGRYYVDLDEFDRKHNLRGQIAAAKATLEADSRLAGLI
jgi:hypothetical protein